MLHNTITFLRGRAHGNLASPECSSRQHKKRIEMNLKISLIIFTTLLVNTLSAAPTKKPLFQTKRTFSQSKKCAHVSLFYEPITEKSPLLITSLTKQQPLAPTQKMLDLPAKQLLAAINKCLKELEGDKTATETALQLNETNKTGAVVVHLVFSKQTPLSTDPNITLTITVYGNTPEIPPHVLELLQETIKGESFFKRHKGKLIGIPCALIGAIVLAQSRSQEADGQAGSGSSTGSGSGKTSEQPTTPTPNPASPTARLPDGRPIPAPVRRPALPPSAPAFEADAVEDVIPLATQDAPELERNALAQALLNTLGHEYSEFVDRAPKAQLTPISQELIYTDVFVQNNVMQNDLAILAQSTAPDDFVKCAIIAQHTPINLHELGALATHVQQLNAHGGLNTYILMYKNSEGSFRLLYSEKTVEGAASLAHHNYTTFEEALQQLGWLIGQFNTSIRTGKQ